MILDYIETIRKKELAVRQQYALVASFIFTGLVVSVWLSVIIFGAHTEQVAPVTDTDPLLDDLKNTGGSLWSTFTSEVSSIFQVSSESASTTHAREELPYTQETGFRNTFSPEIQRTEQGTTTDVLQDIGQNASSSSFEEMSQDVRVDETPHEALVNETVQEHNPGE